MGGIASEPKTSQLFQNLGLLLLLYSGSGLKESHNTVKSMEGKAVRKRVSSEAVQSGVVQDAVLSGIRDLANWFQKVTR